MKTSLDLKAVPREVLLEIIAQLQRRIETLEGKVKTGCLWGMPGIKPKSSQRPSENQGAEKGAEKSPRNLGPTASPASA